jgi:sulfate transport system permease protein
MSHLAAPIAPSSPVWPLRFKQPSVMPGFGLTLGYTLFYLGLLVLIPLAGLVLKAASVSPAQFWAITTAPRTLAALKLSFGAAFVAATLNVLFGLLLAWVLVRYRFPGRGLINSLVDLPFALPTAVAGITLTAAYSKNGVFGASPTPRSA